jgi:hypothetical protein
MKTLTLFLAICLPACAQFNFFTALSTWKGSADTNSPKLYLPLSEASGDAIATTGPNFTQSGTVGALSPGRGTYTTNNYFSHSDSFAPNMGSNSFTVTAWVKSSYYYTNLGSVIIESGSSTNWHFKLLGPYNDGIDNFDVIMEMRDSTNGTKGIGLGEFATNVNSWNFIVGQFNQPANALSVSVNASFSATNFLSSTAMGSPSSQTFNVGSPVSDTVASPFTGYIQHLRVYTRLLSGTELTNLYNGGTPN